MKVILLKDIKNLGESGSLIEVSEGHARNYLLPNKLAEIASPQAIVDRKKKISLKEQKAFSQRDELIKNKDLLDALSIEIKADAGEGGKLFGSVTKEAIASALQAKSNLKIDKKMILQDEAIRHTGDFNVTVKLFSDISAKVGIKVVAS